MPSEPKAQRIENVQCPYCDEFSFIEHDSQNMSVTPKCPCGYQFRLDDLFGQSPAMRKASARRAGPEFAWIVRLFDYNEHLERDISRLCTKLAECEAQIETLKGLIDAK